MTIALQPVRDPLEIDQDWLELYECDGVEEEEAEATQDICLTFVNECIDNIHSCFTFDAYLMEIQPLATLNMKVRLKNVKDADCFMEKYQLNVYDSEPDGTNFLGGQVAMSLINFRY